MKTFKSIAIVLAVVLFAAFMGVMFLPIDTFVAEKMAKSKGYNVPAAYEDVEYRYYYNKLNATEQIAYRIIDSAFFANEEEGFPKQIVVPDLSNEELEEVYCAISYDNPEYYFLGNKCSMTSIGSINYFNPQYLMSMEEYKESWSAVKAKADAIIASVPAGSTDYGIELYIHDYLAENCTYAESGTSMIYTMHGLLYDGSANCEGYSRTAQYLLRECGIYNYLAIGEAEGTKGTASGHMWNIVEIDGSLYNLDITWDDYMIGESATLGDNSASHVYFNISTADMKATHSMEDESVWEKCTASSYGYFINNNTYIYTYDHAARNYIACALGNSLNAGHSSVEIACANKETYDAALNGLMNSDLYSVIVTANQYATTGNKINLSSSSLSYQYTTDEDKFILRFFFNK